MSKLISTMPKGGKREGAGRKPRDPSAPLSRSLTPLAVRLSEEKRKQLQETAERLGMKEADATREAIDDWLDKHNPNTKDRDA